MPLRPRRGRRDNGHATTTVWCEFVTDQRWLDNRERMALRAFAWPVWTGVAYRDRDRVGDIQHAVFKKHRAALAEAWPHSYPMLPDDPNRYDLVGQISNGRSDRTLVPPAWLSAQWQAERDL